MTLYNAQDGKILWPSDFVLTSLTQAEIAPIIETIGRTVEDEMDEAEILEQEPGTRHARLLHPGECDAAAIRH